MGQILMTGGGGGIDLDAITAVADDVLAGKIIVDQNGDPLTGTLTLSGDAGAADVLSGKTFYTTDAKNRQTGTMGTMGGGTYTPSSVWQTISCNGKKMTGDISIVGDGNLNAGNIRSGVSIFGVSGGVHQYAVWEGSVATSGYGIFTYSGNNGSTYLPYLAISGFWFTPLTVSAYAWIGSSRSFTGYDGYNYMPDTGHNYQPNTGSASFAYNSLVVPVKAAGTYSVRIIGYY